MNIAGDIKYFLGEGEYAQLKFSESATSFSIDTVMVPSVHRNKGIGALLIHRVLLLADGVDKDVYLSARPVGNISEERLTRLVNYYRRFGFEAVDHGLTMVCMVRK